MINIDIRLSIRHVSEEKLNHTIVKLPSIKNYNDECIFELVCSSQENK
jgi:hypothetical protein